MLMRIGIIGLGYVGEALALAAMNSGHSVIGVDINQDKIIELQNKFKDFEFFGTLNYEDIKDCEVVVVAVPTPLADDKTPDTSLLKSAISKMKNNLKSGVLIVNESTSYPGTLRNLFREKLGSDYLYAAAPERIDPNSRNWNLKNTPRILSGLSEEATKKAFSFYSSFCDQVIVVSTPEVAEAAKLLENSFRQINISLVNEFAQIAEKFGISAIETIKAAATKPYGFMPFFPGVGVGGHCIPVDPTYLSFAIEELGGNAEFIKLANKVNLGMPKYVANRLKKDFGGDIKGKKIQIAGIAYKAGVSDLRESPALLLINELRKFGAEVSWHDPLVINWAGETSKPLDRTIDLGVIVTPHLEIDFTPWREGKLKVVDLSATSQEFGWTKYL